MRVESCEDLTTATDLYSGQARIRAKMLLKSLQNSMLITQLLLILLVPSHHCQFLVSDDGGDDNVCGAESQCVIISKCPAVLKLVFKVSTQLKQKSLIQAAIISLNLMKMTYPCFPFLSTLDCKKMSSLLWYCNYMTIVKAYK